EIKEGETVPADLKVTDQEGKEHLVADLTKEHGIVIFFYPKANTPGCTKQACGFRDNYDVLKEKGYEVFGLSSDTAKSQSNWKTKYKLQYTLLTDDHSKALKTFGAFKGGKIVRSHVIIEKG
ncbi:thioredoxin-like protein, partial [Chytridium lagenaria]